MEAGQHQREALSQHQRASFPQLPLDDGHLMAERDDLPVAVVQQEMAE